jgi:HlyD family secretion protein
MSQTKQHSDGNVGDRHEVDGDGLPLLVVQHPPDSRHSERHKRPWRRRFLIGLVVIGSVIAAVVAMTGIATQRDTTQIAATQAVLKPAPRVLKPGVAALGVLKPISNVATVGLPGGVIDARIAEMLVKAGDRVAAGDTLAVLDTLAGLDAALHRADAEVELRKAELARTVETLAIRRQEAESAIAIARSERILADQRLERTTALTRTSAAPLTTLDDQTAARKKAISELELAQAKLSHLPVAIETHPDARAAAQAVSVAEADKAVATANLARARVTAPFAGTILAIEARPGERPGSKGILRMGDVSRMTALVEVFHTRIGQIRLGARVSLIAGTLERPLEGQVSAIGLEVRPQEVISPDPAANINSRVVEVTVTLDPESSVLAAKLTNLQVLATIATQTPP